VKCDDTLSLLGRAPLHAVNPAPPALGSRGKAGACRVDVLVHMVLAGRAPVPRVVQGALRGMAGACILLSVLAHTPDLLVW
jgi:hypothetical protein